MGNEICELAVHSFPWPQPCRFLLQELEGHEQHIQHVPEAGQKWSLFLPASAVLLLPVHSRAGTEAQGSEGLPEQVKAQPFPQQIDQGAVKTEF